VSIGAEAAGSWIVRWSPVGGLVFVVGAVILAFTPALEGPGDTPAEVVAFAEDNEFWAATLTIFSLASLLLLGWFVAGLAVRLREAGASAEAAVALAGGVTFVVLSFVAFTIFTAPQFGITEDDNSSAEKLSIASTFLNIDDIGWVVLGGSGVGAGLMAIAASLGALRTRSAPAWASWIGVFLGVLALATIAFVGVFGWLLWIGLTSLGMLFYRRPRQLRTGAPGAGPPAAG
jgi:hypothetical protein